MDLRVKGTYMSKKFSNTVDFFGIDGIFWNLRFLEFHFYSERPNLSYKQLYIKELKLILITDT